MTGLLKTKYPNISIPCPDKSIITKFSNRKLKKLYQWNIDQALSVARQRNDRWNEMFFESMSADNMSTADMDRINFYLFGSTEGISLKPCHGNT